ncbi:hypothetical protein ACEN2P_14845 [Pedobacter psychrotolerans]|uniref:hypothetical protein n=1 Tax=Pedobacter psychrotolerans TaxID=1843235 RepID=UPI003F9AF35A
MDEDCVLHQPNCAEGNLGAKNNLYMNPVSKKIDSLELEFKRGYNLVGKEGIHSKQLIFPTAVKLCTSYDK